MTADSDGPAPPLDDDDAVEASPLVLLRLRLRLDEGDEAWLVRFLAIRQHYEAGDNRGAGRQLAQLLAEAGLPEPLRDEALSLQRRLRPDSVALLVAGLSAILLIAIWVAAVSAG